MSAQAGGLTGSSPSPHLPTILCLHGGGTSSTIFNIQTIRLQRALSSHFTFIFLDAPFEAPPGPGVLPVFEGCGPFYRWVSLGKDGLPQETKDLIKRTVNERGKDDEKSNVVGVLGFSQGAKLAAGLLLEQQLRLKGLANGEFQADSDFPTFKFGVFLNGTSPPLVSSSLTASQRRERIRIPGLHVIGMEDPWRDESRKLYSDSFDEDFSTLLELQIGHRLPTAEKDTQRIAEEIVKLYRETRRGVNTTSVQLGA